MLHSLYKKNAFLVFLALGLLVSVYYSNSWGNLIFNFNTPVNFNSFNKDSHLNFSIQKEYRKKKLSTLKFRCSSSCFVVYTTDGSDPLKNGHKWKGEKIFIPDLPFVIPKIGSAINSLHWRPPFLTNESRLLRAVCVNSITQSVSNEQTILIPDEEIVLNLPLISICVDPSSLSGFFSGIQVLGIHQEFNPTKSWWEQKGNFTNRGKFAKVKSSLCIQDSLNVISSAVGSFSVSGNASRAFPKKSFSFKFDPTSSVNAIRIGENKEYSSEIILRGGSNDWNKALIRDAFAELIAQSVFGPDSRGVMPSLLYLNGEYFGLYFLYPKINEKSLANKYKVNESNLLFFEEGNSSEVDSESQIKISELLQFLNDDKIHWSEKNKIIQEEIDLSNFYRYMAFQIFFSNQDWPSGNNKMFKIKNYGKWKFIPNDLDISMGTKGALSDFQLDYFKILKESKSLLSVIFNSLMNDSFQKKYFLSVFQKLLDNELAEKNVLLQLKRFKMKIQPHIPAHIERWRSHNSEKDWESEIKTIENFLHARSEFLKQYLLHERGA